MHLRLITRTNPYIHQFKTPRKSNKNKPHNFTTNSKSLSLSTHKNIHKNSSNNTPNNEHNNSNHKPNYSTPNGFSISTFKYISEFLRSKSSETMLKKT